MTQAEQLSRDDHALAVVFGPPGPKMITAVEMLQTITQAALQECVVAETNSLHDWKEACSAGANFIAVSQYPSPEFCEYIEGNAIPVIVVANDPLHSVAHLVGGCHSEISAVRNISASFSCLAKVFAPNGAEIQFSNSRNVTAFLVRLAEMSGISVSAADLEHIEIQASELASRFDDMAKHGRSVLSGAESSCTFAGAALPQLHDFHRFGRGVRLEWPARAFYLGDFPDTPMQAAVDIAGPARCLLYGPYLHLPAGRWKACLTLGLADHDGGQSFTVEVVCHEVIAKGRFYCHGAGLFEVQMDFAHSNPHVPMELRIFLDVGAIYGVLSSFEVCLALSGQGLI